MALDEYKFIVPEEETSEEQLQRLLNEIKELEMKLL